MDKLFIESDYLTPKVELDPETGVLSFSGRMMPIDTYTFFEPVKQWISEYIEDPRDKTVIKIFVDGINTSSAKCLMIYFKTLSILLEQDKEVVAEWYYEDDEDVDDWRDYLSSFKIPVHYIKM